MSRIGKLPVSIPSGVDVRIGESEVHVKGPKGELHQRFLPVVDVRVEDAKIVIARHGNAKEARSAHGLTRTLIDNMVQG
ncbi:MAG: 50S ribosomal protein L6, partial [Candidatus Eremiobacteraeota bacterium]|nr:50S ribosomal protein L6 [Candidatus Eremiobacteraeota bacterium]